MTKPLVSHISILASKLFICVYMGLNVFRSQGTRKDPLAWEKGTLSGRRNWEQMCYESQRANAVGRGKGLSKDSWHGDKGGGDWKRVT